MFQRPVELKAEALSLASQFKSTASQRDIVTISQPVNTSLRCYVRLVGCTLVSAESSNLTANMMPSQLPFVSFATGTHSMHHYIFAFVLDRPTRRKTLIAPPLKFYSAVDEFQLLFRSLQLRTTPCFVLRCTSPKCRRQALFLAVQRDDTTVVFVFFCKTNICLCSKHIACADRSFTTLS